MLQFWGAWSFVWGLIPQKLPSPVATELHQSKLQRQTKATLMSFWFQVVEPREYAAGQADAHPGLQDRILLNYTRIENAHIVMYERKLSIFVMYGSQQTFSFPFSLPRHCQMPECFYINNCCFWARATDLSCYINW